MSEGSEAVNIIIKIYNIYIYIYEAEPVAIQPRGGRRAIPGGWRAPRECKNARICPVALDVLIFNIDVIYYAQIIRPAKSGPLPLLPLATLSIATLVVLFWSDLTCILQNVFPP